MEVSEITEKELKNIVNTGNKVIIDCYAPWCGPCTQLSPIIDEMATERTDYKFYKINIDNAEEISYRYEIMSIPTILIFQNKRLKNKIIGYKTKEELNNLLNQ